MAHLSRSSSPHQSKSRHHRPRGLPSLLSDGITNSFIGNARNNSCMFYGRGNNTFCHPILSNFHEVRSLKTAADANKKSARRTPLVLHRTSYMTY